MLGHHLTLVTASSNPCWSSPQVPHSGCVFMHSCSLPSVLTGLLRLCSTSGSWRTPPFRYIPSVQTKSTWPALLYQADIQLKWWSSHWQDQMVLKFIPLVGSNTRWYLTFTLAWICREQSDLQQTSCVFFWEADPPLAVLKTCIVKIKLFICLTMAFEKFVLLPKDHVIVQKTQFHYVSHYTT